MSNSSLVNYKKLSPNHSGTRNTKVDRISPHCVVGNCTVESLGAWFALKSTKASSNYGIGKDGKIGMYVEEGNRSWCTSSSANDQRAVTIECASDSFAPYAMTDAVYQSLIQLCIDICKRNGKTKLLWFGDKTKTLNYQPTANEMVITVHRWFANKSCPGDWLYARLPDLAAKVTKALGGKVTEDPAPEKKTDVPFIVRISIDDLNIRTGPGVSYPRTGIYTGRGAFTIVATSTVNGVEWGKLKSGAGWICLGYATRV